MNKRKELWTEMGLKIFILCVHGAENERLVPLPFLPFLGKEKFSTIFVLFCARARKKGIIMAERHLVSDEITFHPEAFLYLYDWNMAVIMMRLDFCLLFFYSF